MIKKHIGIGFLVGLISCAIGTLLATILIGWYSTNSESILMILKAAWSEGFLTKIISLGAIANLIVFFLFLKLKKEYKARGVLIATILIALLTFLLKFSS